MKLPFNKTRLTIVKENPSAIGLAKRGRLVVPLHRLREDPRNERKDFTGMEGLIASVREHGIVEPITVTPEGDNFLILTGHRRFRAAHAAGLLDVEILIREPEAETARRLKSLISNVQRENLSAIEMAEALQSMLAEDPTIGTQQELARRIGKSKQWVGEMLHLLMLPPALQEKVRQHGAGVSYDSISKIARLDNPRTQEELLNAAMRGEGTRAIRERVSASRRSGPPAASARAKRTERVQENLDGYTAIVSGPVAEESNRKMRAVIEALLERIKLGYN